MLITLFGAFGMPFATGVFNAEDAEKDGDRKNVTAKKAGQAEGLGE